MSRSPPSQPATAASARHPFLHALGERTRALRARRDMTRKALAQAAQVSERHLANLESGTGNASILVLLQVAQALQCSLAELIGSAPETPSPGRARSRRIALVGLRGAGKSTLGALLAEDLGFPFVELSRQIEAETGLGIGEIQNLYGADGYRRHERRALEAAIQSHPEAVIATPGGLVTDPGSYEFLLTQCCTVWLSAAPEEHMQRVRAQGDLRPMAARHEAMDDLRRILASREPFYARAQWHLDTRGQPLDRSFSELRGMMRSALQLPL